jgi:hypothetical protein
VKKFIAMAIAAAGCALSAGAAQAGNVYWSVGINVSPVGTVVSNVPVYAEPAPVYVPAPVYLAPQPVYLAPPVVYRPAPVYYAPRVVYRPVPVVYSGGYYPYYRHRHGEWRDGRGNGDGRWNDGRWNDQRRYRHD